MKKNSFLSEQFSAQPGWAKGIEGVVIIGGIAFIAYKVYQNYKKTEQIKQENQSVDQAGDDLQQLARAGIYPTFTDTQFQTMSERLVGAMTGCGTDEQAIYDIFSQLVNDADYLKLVSVFGTRGYMPCQWTNPIAYVQYLHDPNSFMGGLASWLQNDMGSDELEQINSILASKSIHYKV